MSAIFAVDVRNFAGGEHCLSEIFMTCGRSGGD